MVNHSPAKRVNPYENPELWRWLRAHVSAHVPAAKRKRAPDPTHYRSRRRKKF